jgi:hypothetical protein
MKIRFYCYVPVCSDGTLMRVCRNSVLVDASEMVIYEFNKYLLSAIDTDFLENDYGQVDDVLIGIGQLERCEIDTYETGGMGFDHSLTRDWVQFEHAIYGECPVWPIWRCTLAQYKATLQGYRRFLDMPINLDSELIIDMADCVPGSEYGIQPAGSSQ